MMIQVLRYCKTIILDCCFSLFCARKPNHPSVPTKKAKTGNDATPTQNDAQAQPKLPMLATGLKKL